MSICQNIKLSNAPLAYSQMQQNICIIVSPLRPEDRLSILGRWNLQENPPTLRTLQALGILLRPLPVSVYGRHLSQLGTF